MKVYIKDASSGKNLPVVLGVFKHKKSGCLFLYFGAHPYLPIAIERTLTEFGQGMKTVEYPEVQAFISKARFFYLTDHNSKKLYDMIINNRIAFEYNQYLENQFFNSDSDYNFCRSAWFQDETDLNNRVLLNFLIDNISKITEDIFIRNTSFLNFPSVYIFIPNMSPNFIFNLHDHNPRKKLSNMFQSKIF